MNNPFLAKIKRAYVAFRSAKTTVIIISVLLALYFLGLVIPQKALIPTAEVYADWKAEYPVLTSVVEFLKLNEIYLSPITIVFLALFFVNLLVVMGHRIPVLLRRMYLFQDRAVQQEDLAESPPTDARALIVPVHKKPSGPEIRAFLKKRFWSVVGGDGERTFVAVRNRYSPVGFLFFHASFLLCLVGGLLVMYTRFAGTFILTEGQEFVPEMTNFSRIYQQPKMLKALPPFFLRLDKVVPRYEGEVGTDLDVDMTLTYGSDAEKVRLKVNEPVERDALSILAIDLGVSPLMILRDRTGREIGGSYYYLNVLSGKEDGFSFPGSPYAFSVRFYPDFVELDGKPDSRSRELKNPVFFLKVDKKGMPVFQGFLPMRQRIAIDDLVLSFEDIRYWVEFYAVREYGNIPLYVGFLLGGIGLVMRLLFYQKTVRLWVQENENSTTIFIDGRSEYYPHAFRSELEDLSNTLEERLRIA
jgi:hypothetical protein